jgi:hypothetical protein
MNKTMKSLYFMSLLFHLVGAKKLSFIQSIVRQRGGSTSMQQLHSSTQNSTLKSQISQGSEVSQKAEKSQSPSVSRKRSLLDYESVALALRLVCELNRQLSTGESDQTSIFYTPPSKRTDPSTFVQNLCKFFNYYDDPYIPAITMIYLDRACSEETYRSDDTYDGGQFLPCPHLNMSNVHKLFLAANILALRTYRNEWPVVFSKGSFHDDITELYWKALQSSDDESLKEITAFELGTLLEWMVSSLGAKGLAIEVEEASIFIENWKQLFKWEHAESGRLDY